MSTDFKTRIAGHRVRPGGHSSWVRERPFLAFVVLAYAISWSLWGLSLALSWVLGGEEPPAAAVLFVLGGFGPAAAAVIVLRATGESIRAWAKAIVRWRVPVRYWLYALMFPAVLLRRSEPAAGCPRRTGRLVASGRPPRSIPGHVRRHLVLPRRPGGAWVAGLRPAPPAGTLVSGQGDADSGPRLGLLASAAGRTSGAGCDRSVDVPLHLGL